MAPRYDITTHPLLSAAAAALFAASPAVFAAQVEAAEHLQDLVAPEPFYSTDPNAAKAKLILVYQVNSQIATGAVLSPVSSVGRGARSVSFRTGAMNQAPTADARATELRDDLRTWVAGGALR
jgi:hypothetical protein